MSHHNVTTRIPARESARPALGGPADETADIVVIGGGGGGLPAALFSRWLGNEVILLEKAPELGGTARKAAFWYWIPNNHALLATGAQEREQDFLRYVARLSRPTLYDPASPTFGVPEHEFAQYRAIFESAAPAAELLNQRGALPYRHVAEAVDYWSELPEDAMPQGRVLIHTDAKETMADGGLRSIDSMATVAERDGVDIRTSHRVQRLILAGDTVAGVEATTADGTSLRVRARKAVIFATGGFTHDTELRRREHPPPELPTALAPKGPAMARRDCQGRASPKSGTRRDLGAVAWCDNDEVLTARTVTARLCWGPRDRRR